MEEQSVWYQTRSCRMDTEKLDLSNRRKNFLGKLQFEVEDYKSDFYIDEFFSKFYKRKKYDIFDLYQNCSNFFDIKVMKILYKGDFVACARFIENEHSNLFINSAFSENHTKLSLGINLFYILIEYTKSQDKKYLYIYESYPNNYSYKSTLSGVEIWNGKKWV
jgi:hypothetical protein